MEEKKKQSRYRTTNYELGEVPRGAGGVEFAGDVAGEDHATAGRADSKARNPIFSDVVIQFCQGIRCLFG